MEWLPEALTILRDALPNIEVTLASQSSPELAGSLLRGKVDVAFLRREVQTPGLVYRLLTKEPLIAVLPYIHHLAARDAIHPRDIEGEIFISVPSATSPVLRAVIDAYLLRVEVALVPAHEVDTLSMAISLVASTGGVALLPLYARHFLPASVVSRPLMGDVPTIDLVIGYNKANTSPLLKAFLAKADDMALSVARKSGL